MWACRPCVQWRTSSAAYLRTAVNGASWGTLNLGGKVCESPCPHAAAYTLNGSLGSDVRVILKVTLLIVKVVLVC